MARDPNHLTPEKDGRFCKRVRGVLYHFGSGGDKDQALREWLAAKDDLQAGRKLRVKRHGASSVSVKSIRDAFLDACEDKVVAGKLSSGTFADYESAVDEFGERVGWGRDPDDLDPSDFTQVRSHWSKRLGPWALDRFIQAVRTMFNHAAAFRLIDRQPFYGRSFSKSSESDKRAGEAKKKKDRGERCFAAGEVGVILAAASGQLRAMILLALNGGMYAKDVANLRRHHVVGREGERLIDFARGKTGGVPWEFVLWPETAEAIDGLANSRKRWQEPRNSADADRLFMTIHGRPWHREHPSGSVDLIAQEFDKLLEGVWLVSTRKPLKRDGVGFGSFRHTHVTAVGDHPDVRACDRVTGHKAHGIKRRYDKIPIHRIKSVTNLARQRLLMGVSDAPVAPAQTTFGQSVPAARPDSAATP